jgi:hypothetical protein
MTEQPENRRLNETITFVSNNIDSGIGASAVSTITALGAASTGTSGGAAIMSGAYTVGSAVGGGVAVGLPMMAVAPAVATISYLNSSSYSTSDPRLSRRERQRRESAQLGTVVGGVVGMGASVTAITACGAGPAGLAAIGGMAGGAMATGVGLLVAGPAIAATAIGFGVYSLF